MAGPGCKVNHIDIDLFGTIFRITSALPHNPLLDRHLVVSCRLMSTFQSPIIDDNKSAMGTVDLPFRSTQELPIHLLMIGLFDDVKVLGCIW